MSVMSLLIGFAGGVVVMVLLRPAVSKATMWTLGATMKTRKAIKSSYNWMAAAAIVALIFIVAKNGGM